MSYGEPAVAEGPSFRGAPSPSPVPIPPPVTSIQVPDVAIPLPSSSSSSPGPSSKGSFESAQPVVTELVEVIKVDLEVDSEDARALSDRMDEEVRSRLHQRCKSKQHPERFLPYPKSHETCQFAHQGRRSFQRGGAKREPLVRTRNLREGLLGDVDVKSEHSGDGSGDESGAVSSRRPSLDPDHGSNFWSLRSSGSSYGFVRWSFVVSSGAFGSLGHGGRRCLG